MELAGFRVSVFLVIVFAILVERLLGSTVKLQVIFVMLLSPNLENA